MATVAKTAVKTAAVKKAAAKKAPSAKVATPKPAAKKPAPTSAPKGVTTLTLTSKNYSSWSLRGWLMVRFAGLPFVERVLPPDDPSTRAEILLLSSSILVPSLVHEGTHVWDTLAMAEYLHEVCPEAKLLPADRAARAHCRAVSGEMHSGFASLRASLPMNLRSHFPKFKVWSRAQSDIDRICTIWRDCIAQYGGPFLFGKHRTIADAMYAPVCTRFVTYDVPLDAVCSAYRDLMLGQPEMQEWLRGAMLEPADIDELDVEF